MIAQVFDPLNVDTVAARSARLAPGAADLSAADRTCRSAADLCLSADTPFRGQPFGWLSGRRG
jgi:hypothetical protein